MNDNTKKWIEAGKKVAADPKSVVSCPDCGIGKLIVKDEFLDEKGKKVDRYMVCDKCGSWNVITMMTPRHT